MPADWWWIEADEFAPTGSGISGFIVSN